MPGAPGDGRALRVTRVRRRRAAAGQPSRAVVTDLLRGELGFDGLAITDALDMRALAQGAAQVVDVIMATPRRRGPAAGHGRSRSHRADGAGPGAGRDARSDGPRPANHGRATRLAASVSGWLVRSAADRRRRMRRAPGPGGRACRPLDHACPERRGPPAAAARRWTLESRSSSPSRPDARRYLVVRDADAGRGAPRHGPSRRSLDGRSDGEIAALRERRPRTTWSSLGTFAATSSPPRRSWPGRAGRGRPTVTVALRTPWDLTAYPEAGTHVCSFGSCRRRWTRWPRRSSARRRSAVASRSNGGLYPRGHGLVTQGAAA